MLAAPPARLQGTTASPRGQGAGSGTDKAVPASRISGNSARSNTAGVKTAIVANPAPRSTAPAAGTASPRAGQGTGPAAAGQVNAGESRAPAPAVALAPPPPAARQRVRILVDSVHAHNSLYAVTGADMYSYHHVYGYRRAFDYLRSRNVSVDELKTGKLTPAKLKGYHAVFINLVSADLPLFGVEEIAALTAYVRAGGGIFFITDHSNCYYHAYKLEPLFDALGLESRFVTACDRSPSALGQGNGWIAVTRFKPHPITAGLGVVAFQTGGAVDDRYAVGMTSPRAWGDKWATQPYGEGTNQGNYGNWKQDPDEPTRQLGVLLARQVERGRIVVVGDQNIFGNPFLNYGDNYRLWLNSMAWLTGRADIADSTPYRSWRPRPVVAYEEPARSAWADTSLGGYYNLFVALGRRNWLFASPEIPEDASLVVFAHNRYQLNPANLNRLAVHLKAGRNVLMLGRRGDPPGTTADVLTQLKGILGEPEIESQDGAQAWSWQGTGQVVLLSQDGQFQNSNVPIPEKAPDAAQSTLLDLLFQLVEQAMPPQRLEVAGALTGGP